MDLHDSSTYPEATKKALAREAVRLSKEIRNGQLTCGIGKPFADGTCEKPCCSGGHLLSRVFTPAELRSLNKNGCPVFEPDGAGPVPGGFPWGLNDRVFSRNEGCTKEQLADRILDFAASMLA